MGRQPPAGAQLRNAPSRCWDRKTNAVLQVLSIVGASRKGGILKEPLEC